MQNALQMYSAEYKISACCEEHTEHEESVMGIQRHWEGLQQKMWDLEEQMRREPDMNVVAKLRDQWWFVMMEISELEDEYGPMLQARSPRPSLGLQRRDAA